MPRGWAEENAAYQFVSPNTWFPFLSDHILIRRIAFSPGDICLHVGAIIFVLIQLVLFLRKRLPIFNKKAP